MQNQKRLIIILCFTLFLTSCSSAIVESINKVVANSTNQPGNGSAPIAGETLNSTSGAPEQSSSAKAELYFGPSVPQEWKQYAGDLLITDDSSRADLKIDLASSEEGIQLASFNRIYAVVAPFDTVTDGLSLQELQATWSTGSITSPNFGQLIMSEATYTVCNHFWGAPYESVIRIVDPQSLVDELWKTSDALAIVPFEEIEPRFKVLKVDGISPLDRPMQVDTYGLTISYHLTGTEAGENLWKLEIDKLSSVIPATNRDESKMAIVMMTGTTALARVTLKKIELNGYEYPIEQVKDWFLSADLRHVSNEVAFMEGCEYTDAFTMQFCSKPDQIKVLENIGVNVVESTGNHVNDYPGDWFANTLKMYQERGWLSFGGGINEEAALQPATTEVNGNKIAFIGCNPVGFETAWATETRAGSANCDYEWMNSKITELKSQGYVVITTFQAWEIDRQMYDEYYRKIFKDAAAAGADIVQGSQAHVPMGFEFVNNSLIHYGLGNFLFDQMEPHNIREFYDRHIIYNGKYISTELLTATLTDWSKPVPMKLKDRQALLDEIFSASGMR